MARRVAKVPARLRGSHQPPATPPGERGDNDEGELLSGRRLLTPQVLQIAITQYAPEQVEKLLRTDLEYNEKRLQIIREHAEKHPDLLEDRKTKRFRRGLYVFLVILALILLRSMPFIALPIASLFGVCGLMIVAGTLINARDRDSDVKEIVLTVKRVLTAGKSRD